MPFKPLTESEVEFEIIQNEEEIPVRGNAMASGDPEADRATEEWIFSELKRGNDWAWCSVEVKATWKEFSGSDFLGGCSYRSEADFRRGDYFADMKAVALERLNAEISKVVSSLESRIEP